MRWGVLGLVLALTGCVAAEPPPLNSASSARTATPPEVNIVSDYPPVKAATIPAITALGYTVAKSEQYWTVFTKPAIPGVTDLPTRLTVTYASIRTHTRVIADTELVQNAGTASEQHVPFPNHPDRARIQAALDQVKAQVEKIPLAERHAPAPPPAEISAHPVGEVAGTTHAATAPGTVPGQTRARID